MEVEPGFGIIWHMAERRIEIGFLERARRYLKGERELPPDVKIIEVFTPDPLRQPVHPKLNNAPLPQREVSLEDVNFRKIPLDWDAIKRVSILVNGFKTTPIDPFDIQSLRPSAELYPAIPMVASAIVNHYNPQFPIILPTEEEIMAMKPWLKKISMVIGKFSQRGQTRFGKVIEGWGEREVRNAAGQILRKVDVLGEIENPRDRFVPELAEIYGQVTISRTETLPGIFWDSVEEVSVEDRVRELLTEIMAARRGDSRWINRENFPLVSRVLRVSGFPPDDLNISEAGIVGSELLQGIQNYLRSEGRHVSDAPAPIKAVEFWDPETWGVDNVLRWVGEYFEPERIEAVKKGLPEILKEVKNSLPKSGFKVLEAVRTLAENVLILSKQGVSNAEIAAAIFAKKTDK